METDEFLEVSTCIIVCQLMLNDSSETFQICDINIKIKLDNVERRYL